MIADCFKSVLLFITELRIKSRIQLFIVQEIVQLHSSALWKICSPLWMTATIYYANFRILSSTCDLYSKAEKRIISTYLSSWSRSIIYDHLSRSLIFLRLRSTRARNLTADVGFSSGNNNYVYSKESQLIFLSAFGTTASTGRKCF